MKKLLTSLLILAIISGCVLIVSTNFGNAQSTTEYKVSGYILDSNGKGLAGALFNMYPVGQIRTDNSGYYQTYASTGYYTLNVWPPFDSNYLAYTQYGFAVETSDITKNITLTAGIKLSGYIKDVTGTPIMGAIGFLDQYYTGWYSNSSGYYFITAPAGTYTLKLEARTGPTFQTFNEFNVVLNQNNIKNIVIGDPSNLPTYEISGYISDANGRGISGAKINFGVYYVTSATSDSTGYYKSSAPSGTYHIQVLPPFDSNYVWHNNLVLQVGNTSVTQNVTLNVGYKVSGYLTDSAGIPIKGALPLLSNYCCGWYSNESGYYFVTAPVGVYTLKIQPRTSLDFPIYTEANFNLTHDISRNFILSSSSSTSTPANDQKIFEVQSNSTVSELAFNSTDLSLSFKVSGPSGTTGYTKALIAKSLVPTFTGASVSLDGKNLTFSVLSTNDYWVMEFTYGHSTHQVTIDLADNNLNADQTPVQSQPPISTIPELTPVTLVFAVVLASVALAFARKKLNPPHSVVTN